jgi:CTP-dependent riboflavin kinase
MSGWVKIDRKLLNDPMYLSEPFTKGQAWIDMILLANYKDNHFYKRGIRVDVLRGQVGMDLDTLAKRWQWSRGKAERFMNTLENENKIVRQKTNVTTLFSIINYHLYQTDGKANDNANDNANGNEIIKQTTTQTVSQTVTQTEQTKERKEIKKEKKEKLLGRKQDFRDQLFFFSSEYPESMLEEFFDYWTEENKSGTQMKFELQVTWDLSKRLARWSKNNFKSIPKIQSNEQSDRKSERNAVVERTMARIGIKNENDFSRGTGNQQGFSFED